MNFNFRGSIIPLALLGSCHAWNQWGTYSGGWSNIPPEPQPRHSYTGPAEGNPNFPYVPADQTTQEGEGDNEVGQHSEQRAESTRIPFVAGDQSAANFGPLCVTDVPSLGENGKVMNRGDTTSAQYRYGAYGLSTHQAAVPTHWSNPGSYMNAYSMGNQDPSKLQEPTGSEGPSITDTDPITNHQPRPAYDEPLVAENAPDVQPVINRASYKSHWSNAMQGPKYNPQVSNGPSAIASNPGSYMDYFSSKTLPSDPAVEQPQNELAETEPVLEERTSSLQGAQETASSDSYGEELSGVLEPTLNDENLPIFEMSEESKQQQMDLELTNQELLVSDADSYIQENIPVSKLGSIEDYLVAENSADVQPVIGNHKHVSYWSNAVPPPKYTSPFPKNLESIPSNPGSYMDSISSNTLPTEPVVEESRMDLTEPTSFLVKQQVTSLQETIDNAELSAQNNVGLDSYDTEKSDMPELALNEEPPIIEKSSNDKGPFTNQQPATGEPLAAENAPDVLPVFENSGYKSRWSTPMQAPKYNLQVPKGSSTVASNPGSYMDTISSNTLPTDPIIEEPQNDLAETGPVVEELDASLDEASVIAELPVKAHVEEKWDGPESALNEDFLQESDDIEQQQGVDLEATKQEIPVADNPILEQSREPDRSLKAENPVDVQPAIEKRGFVPNWSKAVPPPKYKALFPKGAQTVASNLGSDSDKIPSSLPTDPVLEDPRSEWAEPQRALGEQPLSVQEGPISDDPPAQDNVSTWAYSNKESNGDEPGLEEDSLNTNNFDTSSRIEGGQPWQNNKFMKDTPVAEKPQMSTFANERMLFEKEKQELSAQIKDERTKMNQWGKKNKEDSRKSEKLLKDTNASQQLLFEEAGVTEEPPIAETPPADAPIKLSVEESTVEKPAVEKAYVYRPSQPAVPKDQSAANRKQRRTQPPSSSKALRNEPTNPISYFDKMSIYKKPSEPTKEGADAEPSVNDDQLLVEEPPSSEKSVVSASDVTALSEPDAAIEDKDSLTQEPTLSKNTTNRDGSTAETVALSKPEPFMKDAKTLFEHPSESEKSTFAKIDVTGLSESKSMKDKEPLLEEKPALSGDESVKDGLSLGLSEAEAVTEAEEPSSEKSLVAATDVTELSELEAVIKDKDSLTEEPSLSKNTTNIEGSTAELSKTEPSMKDGKTLVKDPSESEKSPIAKIDVTGFSESKQMKDKEPLLGEKKVSGDKSVKEGLSLGLSKAESTTEVEEPSSSENSLVAATDVTERTELEAVIEDKDTLIKEPSLSKNTTDMEGSTAELSKPEPSMKGGKTLLENPSESGKSTIAKIDVIGFSESKSMKDKGPLLGEKKMSGDESMKESSSRGLSKAESTAEAEEPTPLAEPFAAIQDKGPFAEASAVMGSSTPGVSIAKPVMEDDNRIDEKLAQSEMSIVTEIFVTGLSQAKAAIEDEGPLAEDRAVAEGGTAEILHADPFMEVEKPLYEELALFENLTVAEIDGTEEPALSEKSTDAEFDMTTRSQLAFASDESDPQTQSDPQTLRTDKAVAKSSAAEISKAKPVKESKEPPKRDSTLSEDMALASSVDSISEAETIMKEEKSSVEVPSHNEESIEVAGRSAVDEKSEIEPVMKAPHISVEDAVESKAPAVPQIQKDELPFFAAFVAPRPKGRPWGTNGRP